MDFKSRKKEKQVCLGIIGENSSVQMFAIFGQGRKYSGTGVSVGDRRILLHCVLLSSAILCETNNKRRL